MQFLENQYFLLALTFGFFFLAKELQRRSRFILLNPVLIAIVLLIAFLKLWGIPYESYNAGGKMLEFWLKPAVVALAVPLYEQLETIKKDLLPIILSQFFGCLIGILSVVSLAQLFGASKPVILSLASKSVTTPIAMEVTQAIHGIPALTAVIVIMVGLFGAVFGHKTVHLARVRNPYSQGISMGTASHAIGTSAAMEMSSLHGAYASLGLTLNGIFTALLTPTIISFMGLG